MSFRDPRELRREARRLMATAAAIEDGTWSAVVHGDGTAAAVSAAVGCTAPGANNRLVKLYELGLLDREVELLDGGGRRFVYKVALSDRPGTRAP